MKLFLDGVISGSFVTAEALYIAVIQKQRLKLLNMVLCREFELS